MEQTKIVKLLRLMKLLTGNVSRTIDHIAKELGITPRTVYRSGHILKEFRVKRGADGLWHITKVFTTDKESIEYLMVEVINYGYWEVPLGNRL